MQNERFRAVLLRLWEHWLVQIDHLDVLTKQLEIAIKDNDVCQKQMKLEGVGPLRGFKSCLAIRERRELLNWKKCLSQHRLNTKTE